MESRSSLKTAEVIGMPLAKQELTVKAARAFKPGGFSIDVKSNCSIRVWFMPQRYGAMYGREKTTIFVFVGCYV